MSFELDSALVSTEWLAQHLGAENLRIFDCTVILGFDPEQGIFARGAREEYKTSHIPGASFLDLYEDLSIHRNNAWFMMPSPEVVNRVLSESGLGNEHQVVLYSAGNIYWATRMWWMLRASGFTNAAVLDGGLQQWNADGRPTATGQEQYPPATFTAKPDHDRWVDKDMVHDGIENHNVCIINTLSREEHAGTVEHSPFEKQAYGRKGRIKSSLNVPYSSLLTDDGCFVSRDQIQKAFNDIGALGRERIIGYCGAGLSSTIGALALHLIGYDNVAIYDGSLVEWGHDDSLPMETD